MQSAYIGKLMEIAERDDKVMHLLADSGTGYDEMFRYNFPKQIYNFGISEEHMVAAAAGMATVGYVPFVYTAGAFLAYRSLEFIRDDICFQNLNVKIVGMGSGLSWSSLGPTHHTTEDVAVLRSLPHLLLLSPATPRQVAACVQVAYEHHGPVYIRIGMNHEKEFFADNYTLNTASNDVLQENGDISIFVTGSILEEVQGAVEALEKEGYGVNLINVPVIKPLANGQILSMAKKSRLCFTVEEHNVLGGMGSAIAEVLTENGVGVPLYRIGLKDIFAMGYGTHAAVRKANSLDAYSIYQQIKERL
ncbi:transketolase family protein [Selenomonas ruminantium]|uniref:Transketolase n=1 Tax=Selenomonas ruminantium TaxID=971 RepID=A0A1K1QNQ6_SELRU|nr:transketolase C-terminal domain-containing protein [Selenomonas ruminantium]SFW61267.1 transketolase [Selenomonas ruminantium]